MSVIVKGMKMPKTCIECGWHEYYGGDYDWCHACQMTGSMPIECSVVELGRADNCPLVELPEKHGDLIDAGSLKEKFPKDTDWEYPVNTNEYVCEMIDNAPTVIEAEGEE